jgi:hypothetical protein
VALSLSEPDKQRATLRPVRSVAELTFGAVKPRRRPEDLKQLRRQFESTVAEQVLSEKPSQALP